jgi:hypothetical protein
MPLPSADGVSGTSRPTDRTEPAVPVTSNEGSVNLPFLEGTQLD